MQKLQLSDISLSFMFSYKHRFLVKSWFRSILKISDFTVKIPIKISGTMRWRKNHQRCGSSLWCFTTLLMIISCYSFPFRCRRPFSPSLSTYAAPSHSWSWPVYDWWIQQSRSVRCRDILRHLSYGSIALFQDNHSKVKSTDMNSLVICFQSMPSPSFDYSWLPITRTFKGN